MATSDSPVAQYACKCLNVRIISAQPPTSAPEATCDSAYTSIFVGDDDIVVTHPQVTVRTTTHPKPIPGTARHSRFTVLTCLLCQLPIYRVFQTISLEIQGRESVLLPTEDWVERDILKSATGWIQVHKDSIVGDSVSQAELSPSYARPFSLLLPPSSSPPSSSPKMTTEACSSDSTQPPTQSCLSHLRPLFFPPPFTPSHPIFVHLASVASKESQELRAAAEQRIADFVKAEIAGLDAREQELRYQVEVLWKKYKDHLKALQQEPRQQTPNPVRLPVSRNGAFGPSGLGVSTMNSSSSVAVRNFDPVPIASPSSLSSSAPRVSALSASLATSTFHHPHANEARSRSPAHSSGSASSRTLSTHSRTSTLVPDAAPTAATNVSKFRRYVNDTLNTQSSYKYFVNLEEDMARYKRSQEQTMKEQQEAEAAKRAQQVGPSQAASGSNTNGKLKSKTVQATTEDGSTSHEETISPRGRDKGKRKVTFDVEPAVMTIKTEIDGKVEEDVATEQDSREMVFAFEDLEGEEDLSDIQDSALPLLEQPVSRPLRPRKMRPQNIETFSSLRPSSLPNPSHIRPMRQPHVDSSKAMLPPKVPTTPTRAGSLSPPLLYGSSPITNEHDAELLRLVAADTPSHRGAWTPSSRAWQTFTRRQDSKGTLGRSKIPEEGEEETNFAAERSPVVSEDQPSDDDYDVASSSQPPISRSVPISIIIRHRQPEDLSLASYQPKTEVPNQPRSSNGNVPSVPHGQKTQSSATIRKAKYAERDRSRPLDPGALDFASGEDEDDAEEEMEADQLIPSGERGRKQALKILKAQSEVPEAGMWRSLA